MSDISAYSTVRHTFKNKAPAIFLAGAHSVNAFFRLPPYRQPEKHKHCFSSPQLFKDFRPRWQASL
jgi:hypothetical protein